MASILLHLPGEPLFDPSPDLATKRDLGLVDVWDSAGVGAIGRSSGGLDARQPLQITRTRSDW